MIDFNKMDSLLKGAGISENARKKVAKLLITYLRETEIKKDSAVKDQYIQQIIQMFRKNPDFEDSVFYSYISFAMSQCAKLD